ncbi:CpaD family pilus assembly lipoprotein [Hyphobacterium marinum]|uniref:CpaD family pilus assembly lipoprotein n=1 Tax=Hyphobacterium marinum TaxID=3116574 RepID=A0ABU7LW52_9PROT|nr:CpaD family pilus assembly lipoprotein [Hyphobacterium sp. Y6023]MEE2565793.1 CpaD family pilus assembly lipoprotein [Hyphobacterium sp. Y6023]
MLKQSLVLAAAAIALAGCYTMPEDRAGAWPRAEVRQETARMDLQVSAEEGGIAWAQMGTFSQFVNFYKSNGHGPFVLSYPDRSTNSRVTAAALQEARAFLDSQGIAPQRIAEGEYDAQGQPNAPLIVSFMHYAAGVPEECALMEWENVAMEVDNRAQPRFGCFMAANMAAMIGDPYDLVGPTETAPRDAGRIGVQMDAWRAGERTGATRGDDESGTVSTAVD